MSHGSASKWSGLILFASRHTVAIQVAMTSAALFLLPLVAIHLAFGRNVHGNDEEGAPFENSGAVGGPSEGWRGNGLGGRGAFPDGRIGGAPGGRREFGAGPVEGDDGNADSGRKYPSGGSRGSFDGNRGGRRGGRGRHGKHHRHCNGTTEAPSIFGRDNNYRILPVMQRSEINSEELLCCSMTNTIL
uniref:Col_cuticle_N domain-containing protein n=1 Tax=Steinernema glaseri TaxID=37863 RepID=A0A1I7YPF6_9BILA